MPRYDPQRANLEKPAAAPFPGDHLPRRGTKGRRRTDALQRNVVTDPGTPAAPRDETQGEAPTGTLPHLEGGEQGPNQSPISETPS